MSDPFSIAVGIIAVAGAAATVAKYAQSFCRKAEEAADEVQIFASQIDNFASIISLVHNTIREHYMNSKDSVALQRFHEQSTLKNLAFETKHLIRRMKSVEPRVRGKGKGFGLKARFMWGWHSDEREEVLIRMERIKTSFLLVMLGVLYETLQQRASNPASFPPELFDFARDLKEHKRLMKMHIKAMSYWKDRQDGLNRKMSRIRDETHDVILNDVEKAVLNLGEEMVAERAFRSSSFVSTATGSISSSGTENYEARRPSAPVTVERPGNLAPTPMLPEPLRLPAALHPPSDPPDRGETEAPEASSPSSVDDSGVVEQRTWDDGDYMAVIPSNNLLNMDPDLNKVAISGYINSSLQPTNAKINEEFPQNVISQQLVAKLGLLIDNFDDEEDERIVIDFGGGDMQTVRGTVKFRWKRRPQEENLRPLSVTAMVCEYTPFQLIFGKLFLKKRLHYWGEHGFREV